MPTSTTNTLTAQERPVFVLHLRAEPGNTDPVRNLRLLLKAALRRFGFRCTEIVEVREGD